MDDRGNKFLLKVVSGSITDEIQIVSSTKQVMIEFTSDESENDSGFLIGYQNTDGFYKSNK